MRTLDIGLDIDNVLYPWSTVMTRWVERRKGLAPGTLDDHALSWTWYKDQWGMTSEEFLEHFTAGVHAGVIFSEGDPSPGSVSCVRRLAAAGHRLHYVTDRAIAGVSVEHAWQVTHRWLHDHGFPVDSLTITPDKASVGTDVFLDDAPHNIDALFAAGHPAPLVWDKPHNQRLRTRGAALDVRRAPLNSPIRVRDWHGFERVVETLADIPADSHTPHATIDTTLKDVA